jgi:hypothetical protein
MCFQVTKTDALLIDPDVSAMHEQQVKTQRAKSTLAAPTHEPGRMAALPARRPAHIPAWAEARGLAPAPSLFVQTKPAVNQPGDAYEQEANRVAEQIMRMPAPSPSAAAAPPLPPAPSGTPPGVQRACAYGRPLGPDSEDCEECRKNMTLQRKTAPPVSPIVVPPIVQNVLDSPGQPLDAGTRAFMEPRFGADFSRVRVHTDAMAAESARAVNALAYTVGHDIVFGAGQYAPARSMGRQLLAHELTHVNQQAVAALGPATLQRQPRDLPRAPNVSNLLLFPAVAPTQVRIESLAHLEGGLVTDTSLRPRLSAIVAAGMTIRGLAARLLSLYNNAMPSSAPAANNSPPSVDELAQALLVYNRHYLPVPSMTSFSVGLRLPLPIEIDVTNGDFILNPDMIRLWATSFDPAWIPLLDQAPAGLAMPSSAALDVAVTDFLTAHTTPLDQGIALYARVMSNPFEAVGMSTRLFQRLGASGFDVALEFMNFSVNHQIQLLTSLTPGDAILRQLRRALSMSPPNLPPDREMLRQRALRMLPAAPGWNPLIRADEAAPGGGDRLADQTFVCGEFSVFVPAGAIAMTTNQVHVFFSAGGVIGATSHVEHHGLRGAADTSQWILISVRGEPGRAFTITEAQIIHCLQLVGRPAQLDRVRLSAHSRGNGSMAANLRGRLITPGLIEHVTILDATDFAPSLTEGLRSSGIAANQVTAYDVNLPPFPLAGVQNLVINPLCIRSIGYARLINDAVALGRVAALPSAIASLAGALALPPRGSFTTGAAVAGQTNIQAFCSDPANAAALRDMRRGEMGAAHVSDLASLVDTSPYAFVEWNNLLNINDPSLPRTAWRSVSPGIYSHHLFVAEIAAELFQ